MKLFKLQNDLGYIIKISRKKYIVVVSFELFGDWNDCHKIYCSERFEVKALYSFHFNGRSNVKRVPSKTGMTSKFSMIRKLVIKSQDYLEAYYNLRRGVERFKNQFWFDIMDT